MTAAVSCPDAPSIELFNRWLDTRQIKRHPSLAMTPMSPHSSGFRVVSTSAIPIGSILCAVPKSTIFSHQTASLNLASIPILASEPESSAEVVYRLTACLLHELRLGRESAWYGWLQILPRETIKVPILWDEEEIGGQDGREGLVWLQGTDADRELRRQNEQDGLTKDGLRDFHSSLALPSTASHPSPPSYSDFLYAFSLISSRAFMLDAYHQIGIPPYCDMFNHSSSSAHTSLLCDASVCPECGLLQRCPHDEGDPAEKPERLWHVESEYLATLQATGQGEQVDMRAERDIASGVEVFSCYEEGLKSAKALVGYQFVPAEPTGSRVNWGARDLLDQEAAGPFVQILKRGRVAEGVFGEGSDSEDNRLFKAGGNDMPGSLDFSMDGDGTLSIDIFIAIYVRTAFGHGYDFDSLEEQEEAIIADVRALRAAAAEADREGAAMKCDGGIMAPVLEGIVELLEERLEGMYRPQMSPEDIESEMLSLPASAVLQRQAMSFAMDERRLLRDQVGRWKVLLGDQGTNTTWR